MQLLSGNFPPTRWTLGLQSQGICNAAIAEHMSTNGGGKLPSSFFYLQRQKKTRYHLEMSVCVMSNKAGGLQIV